MTLFQKTYNHKCKIDCSNTSQVLHHLQQKSSHLYLVWSNYNDLYSRYEQVCIQIQNLRAQLNQVNLTPKIDINEFEHLKKKIFEYQKTIESLKYQNLMIRQQKRTSTQNQVVLLTSGYEKQIKRLKQVNLQLENIIRLKDDQISKLKNDQDRLKKTFKDEQSKYLYQIDIMNKQTAELKRQIRDQVLKTPVISQKPNQQLQLQINQNRKKDQIIKKLKITITEIEGKYQKNLRDQLQKMKREFQIQLNKQISHYRNQTQQIIIKQTIEVIDQ